MTACKKKVYRTMCESDDGSRRSMKAKGGVSYESRPRKRKGAKKA